MDAETDQVKKLTMGGVEEAKELIRAKFEEGGRHS